MENTELKEYIDNNDCDEMIEYFMGKAELTYGQALQVTEMISRMINVAAVRIAKDMGAIWYGVYGEIFEDVLSLLQDGTSRSDTL